MSKRYTAKAKRAPQEPNAPAASGKKTFGAAKLGLFLALNTLWIAGLYIAGVRLRIEWLFHVYWIGAAVLFCLFLVFKFRHDARPDEDAAGARRIKILLLFLIPLLLTLFGDAVYLFILKDLGLAEAVASLFRH